MVAVVITLLGPPRVTREGAPISFDTRKAMALLANLALSERPRSREALCELLWPDRDLDRARGALRRTLSTLRGAIGAEWIDTAGDSIALRRGAGLELDVARFRALAGAGATLESLSEAAALASGELLEGFFVRDSANFEHWQASEAEGLRRELGSVLRRLVEALVARGEYERAIEHAQRWLEIDPVHEPAHRELIRLYGWTGNRADALEQYRRCVRTLSEELGVGPLEDTAALYAQVEQGTLPVPAAPRDAPIVRSRPSREAPLELPLVGRADELAELVAAHASARPDGALAVIEGEAGIGKTRLANELASRAREAGAVLLTARCHEDEAGIPYGPVIELLRDALRQASGGNAWFEHLPDRRLADASLLLPELAGLRNDLPDPPPLDAPGARTRLLEALTSVIAAACTGPAPGIVLIDDAHAADEATVDVISYLGRRLRERPLLLAIAWRSEGMLPGHRLRRLTIELASEGRATIVTPARLHEQDVGSLLESAHLSNAAPDIERRVYLESEGLPLFVAEYLAALRSGGDPAELDLPQEVKGLLDARLQPLGSVARQVLGAAATIGRSFHVDIAREASGRGEEETIGALEELVTQGLVREVPGTEPIYDFSHQTLRDVVYEQTGLARRRLLHRRVATALMKGRSDGSREALVAQHRRRAGDNAEAAAHYVVAAEQAAALHANADALEYLEAAVALGHPAIAELHERLGDLKMLRGDYAGALVSLETAAAHSDGETIAQCERKLGEVHHRRGEWDRAEARFSAALDATPSEAKGMRSRIQADLGLTLQRSGDAEQAAKLAREALALAEAAGDHRAEAQAHNMLGVLARNDDDLDAALTELECSLALAEELGDDPAVAAALNNLALVRRERGELVPALELTENALALCTAYGDRHREAALENNLADIHNAAGRSEDSMIHLKRAVTAFSEVGGDEGARLPEIWKLASW